MSHSIKVKKRSNHTLAKVTGRFVSGRDLDGQRRTNATFLRRADRDLTEHGRATRWAHKRHAERAAWRIGISVLILITGYGLITERNITVYSIYGALFALFVLGVWRSVMGIRFWNHSRHIVTPLYQTLAPMANHPPSDHHSRYLKVPRDFHANEKAEIRLALNPIWEGSIAQQKQITGLIQRRMNTDILAKWYPHAYPPYAVFCHSPSPPSKVTFAEFKPYMDKSPAHVIPMGLGTSRNLITLDLDTEAPHMALSVGTGGGKTTMMALVIAFLVHNGVERIDVINTKRSGYSWAVGLPGVYIHNTMDSQMRAIHDVRMEMESRYDELLTNDSKTFPRRVLIIEEQNSWMKYAKQYWEDYRTELDSKERSRVSKKNPAISDIGFILFQGRQACVNVISIYQRMSAGAAGDGDMRDQYGAKLLARTSRQAWKILVGTTPVPKDAMSVIRGRAVFVLGDEAHSIQIAYLNEKEAKEYALSGIHSIDTGPGTPTESTQTERYSLREIADSNVIPIRYGALRKAKQRDKTFPISAERLYTVDDIRQWYNNRPNTKRAV